LVVCQNNIIYSNFSIVYLTHLLIYHMITINY